MECVVLDKTVDEQYWIGGKILLNKCEELYQSHIKWMVLDQTHKNLQNPAECACRTKHDLLVMNTLNFRRVHPQT